ncbi:hypothetical protein K2173_009571 [Erythroxylum novogranatense]|uniref:RING-type domain-containing protein n=1 Tax=Erythroxylum novogranatense TaxID=1862640 RepID=A0AAV8U725_9ROSI|nr:hypothetical protein K2173_009571 [Erythroxylum novogranatense]
MGSSGSKSYCGGGSSSSSSSGSGSGNGQKGRSKGGRVFRSYCLRTSSGSRDDTYNGDHVCDHENEENEGNGSSRSEANVESYQVQNEYYRKLKIEQSNKMPCISSNVEHDEWSKGSIRNNTSRTASSSIQAPSTQSLSSPSCFPSRFSFIPGNMSFRLNRATSLGSSRAYSMPSGNPRMFTDEDEIHNLPRTTSSIVDGCESQQSRNPLPMSLISPTQTQCDETTSNGLDFDNEAGNYLEILRENRAPSSVHDIDRDGVRSTSGLDGNLRSPRIVGDADIVETRLSDRRPGSQEPVEHNVHFSRTLSVGRLRHRVLQRSSLTDISFCPLQPEREPRDASQGNTRWPLGGGMRVLESEGNIRVSPTTSAYHPPSMSSLFSIQDNDVENSQSREGRYHDLLEHRSNFLERRRRVRSQVRALQRLGSRFENFSGHERSCILSGQHRTGHCTCRVGNQDTNLSDTSTRASISRIVMLAEALFEVLDEVRQQSVVLSSGPSVSSLGSVPAPNEVVESLPVKLYKKREKYHNEEAAQCYICLVEYDDGDCMRILPCHHEFHSACIDKWLKEIHRVCPLCRGDICSMGER